MSLEWSSAPPVVGNPRFNSERGTMIKQDTLLNFLYMPDCSCSLCKAILTRKNQEKEEEPPMTSKRCPICETSYLNCACNKEEKALALEICPACDHKLDEETGDRLCRYKSDIDGKWLHCTWCCDEHCSKCDEHYDDCECISCYYCDESLDDYSRPGHFCDNVGAYTCLDCCECFNCDECNELVPNSKSYYCNYCETDLCEGCWEINHQNCNNPDAPAECPHNRVSGFIAIKPKELPDWMIDTTLVWATNPDNSELTCKTCGELLTIHNRLVLTDKTETYIKKEPT